jgi:hypothetical protein
MKRLLTIFIIFVMLTGVVACNKTGNSGGNQSKGYTVYSAPNTVKVRRDEDYANKGNAVLNFEMAKNEYEGAQIIVNAKSDTTARSVAMNDVISFFIIFSPKKIFYLFVYFNTLTQ